MNFLRGLLCFGCLPKRKHRRVHPSGTPDKHCRDQEIRATRPHCSADLERLTAQIQCDDTAEIPSKIKRDLDELSTLTRNDLNKTAARIQAEHNDPAAWTKKDLNETAASVRLDPEKLESHLLNERRTPVEEAQHGLEETSMKWEEKAALLQSGLAETDGVSLEDFMLHKVLGRGSFGKVMLAELKGTGEYFAIKTLKKRAILASGHIDFLMAEKQVMMLNAECPFLAHLYFTFQTTENLFFVMEYINGGDLFFHIERKRRFDLVSTQFYAAEITCGLQFLHRNGVIYRDLKTENTMLDRDGHIKIVDFGICKQDMFGEERTETFCGTDQYMAPEVFLGEPYFSPVDWWSLGVVLFEMLTGACPFFGNDAVEICMSVCMDTPHYRHWMTQETKDILEKLLEKDPNHRLGTSGNIREHPFFEAIDWPRLERREVQPPFKPDLVNLSDCRYFDEEYLNEAPRISQVDSSDIIPISQSAFKNFSFISPAF